jgi:hypothetical protein
MNKKVLIFVVVLIPVAAFAQCTQSDAPWIDTFVNWIYSLFGDKVLKLFGVLYGFSLTFKIVNILASKFVLLTTWTEKDNEFLKRLYDNWAYKTLSFIADLFLRLKLPGTKKR